MTKSVKELEQACQEETSRFTANEVYDETPCFQLLELALEDRNDEAFTSIYKIYEHQVIVWVRRHPAFADINEGADYFANIAWLNFYRGVSGERFQGFDTVAGLLIYLKRCVNTAIGMYLRKPFLSTVSIDEMEGFLLAQPQHVANTVQHIWERICELLPQEDEQKLANYAFIKGLKPREIVELDDGKWRNAQHVSKILWHIRKALRSDPVLQEMRVNDDNIE